MEKINKQVLNCKKVETAILRAENILMEYAKNNGVYENFGQTYARVIEEKFLYSLGKDFQSQLKVKEKVIAFSRRMATYSPY